LSMGRYTGLDQHDLRDLSNAGGLSSVRVARLRVFGDDPESHCDCRASERRRGTDLMTSDAEVKAVNPGRSALIYAAVAQSVVVILTVLGVLGMLPRWLWIGGTDADFVLRAGSLLLFVASLSFKEWWSKTALAGVGASAASVLMLFGHGYFNVWTLVALIILIIPTILGTLAWLDGRNFDPNSAPRPPRLSKEQRAERMRVAKQAREANQAQIQAEAGGEVINQAFGLTRVRIYSHGYVKVGSGQIQKLEAISGKAEVLKKTGVGRGVAAVLTGGVNLFSPNIRGDLYLTIVTTSRTHTLHVDSPRHDQVQAMHRLVAAGERVLARAQAGPQGSFAPEQTLDFTDQLARLAELHNSGALSDEQFEQAKSKLLNGG